LELETEVGDRRAGEDPRNLLSEALQSLLVENKYAKVPHCRMSLAEYQPSQNEKE
jgi:hypothetical protein